MKKLSYLMLVVLTFFGFQLRVFAGSLSVWASANTITVGSTITVSVSSKSVFCKYNIKISDGSILSGPNSGNVDDGETTLHTFTAKSAGTVTITIVPVDGADYDNNGEYTQSKSVTIKVVNKNTNNGGSNNNSNSNDNRETVAEKKEYDSDNFLKSLSIDGYELNPSFNKDTSEYKLDVDESVEKINVKASSSSDKAEISGIGERKLSAGDNTIEVKVVAENGNERTYKIIATVKDLNPIKVMIGDKEFVVVKKNNEILDKVDGYEEEIIKINDVDVVSYINRNTKVRLVILKNDKNQVGYYIYNEHTKKYSYYKSLSVGGVTLQLLDLPQKLKNFHKCKVIINQEEIDIYKIKETHQIGLVYGTNVKTGTTGYYVYDGDENTLAKYYDEEVRLINAEYLDFKNKAMIFIGVVSGVAIVVIFVSIIKSIKRRRRRTF